MIKRKAISEIEIFTGVKIGDELKVESLGTVCNKFAIRFTNGLVLLGPVRQELEFVEGKN